MCHKHLMIIDVGARSSDCIQMNLPPFDSSWWDKSNGGKIIFVASILMKLMCHKHLIIIDVGAWSSDCIRMNLPPFDSSWWHESNGSEIMFLASILMELWRYKHLNFFKYYSAKIKVNSGQIFRNTKLITEPEINYGIRNFFNELLNNYRIT